MLLRKLVIMFKLFFEKLFKFNECIRDDFDIWIHSLWITFP